VKVLANRKLLESVDVAELRSAWTAGRLALRNGRAGAHLHRNNSVGRLHLCGIRKRKVASGSAVFADCGRVSGKYFQWVAHPCKYFRTVSSTLVTRTRVTGALAGRRPLPVVEYNLPCSICRQELQVQVF
jgi:hypothetical protein